MNTENTNYYNETKNPFRRLGRWVKSVFCPVAAAKKTNKHENEFNDFPDEHDQTQFMAKYGPPPNFTEPNS